MRLVGPSRLARYLQQRQLNHVTALQIKLYREILSSGSISRVLRGLEGGDGVLVAIGSLRKLCNHPDLIREAVSEEDEAGMLGAGGGGALGLPTAPLVPPTEDDEVGRLIEPPTPPLGLGTAGGDEDV